MTRGPAQESARRHRRTKQRSARWNAYATSRETNAPPRDEAVEVNTGNSSVRDGHRRPPIARADLTTMPIRIEPGKRMQVQRFECGDEEGSPGAPDTIRIAARSPRCRYA